MCFRRVGKSHLHLTTALSTVQNLEKYSGHLLHILPGIRVLQAIAIAKRNPKIAKSIVIHLISGPRCYRCVIIVYQELPSLELPVGDYLKIVMQLKLR